jgi:hypothetical protein
VFPSWISAVGALCSGLAAIVAAVVSVVLARRHARAECDKRIREINRAFDRGLRLRRKMEQDDFEDRWSGLP